jgi:hypothetical protein
MSHPSLKATPPKPWLCRSGPGWSARSARPRRCEQEPDPEHHPQAIGPGQGSESAGENKLVSHSQSGAASRAHILRSGPPYCWTGLLCAAGQSGRLGAGCVVGCLCPGSGHKEGKAARGPATLKLARRAAEQAASRSPSPSRKGTICLCAATPVFQRSAKNCFGSYTVG